MSTALTYIILLVVTAVGAVAITVLALALGWFRESDDERQREIERARKWRDEEKPGTIEQRRRGAGE